MVDRNAPSDVATAFARSLAQNNLEVTKSLADPKLWSRIETWAAKHDRILCPLRLLDLVVPIGHFQAAFGEGWKSIKASASYSCPSQNYHLNVEELILGKMDQEGWQVIDWGWIDESP